jgi:hypothetical protein
MSSIPQSYYVYVLARPDGTPFYVGKGKNGRIFEHDKEARSGHKCHKCDGGEGVSGMKHTVAARRKIAAASTGRPSPKSEEQRRRISATLKGRPLAPHVREAFVKVNIGRTYDEERRTNISLGQTNGRLCTFVSPDGTRYEHIVNIEQFARDHELNGDGLNRCIMGSRKQYRGWQGWIEGQANAPLFVRMSYTIIDPNGTEYPHITNPNAFAKKHGLDGHGLRAMLRGVRDHYKGWTGFKEAS